MRPNRLLHIQPIGVDSMGAAADSVPSRMLRLENLDTDIPPDPEVVAITQQSVTEDENNSYLPFIGQRALREAVSEHVERLSGKRFDPDRNVVISAGGLSGITNVLLAIVETGDEVIVTDPTYAGLINRIRLAGGIPKFVPFVFTPGDYWRLDADALRTAVGHKTRHMLLMSPSMPSGGTFTRDDWRVIADLCMKHDLTLVHDAAMQRLVFDDAVVFDPLQIDGMESRTIAVGAASKELRMIGWRVGWIVAPERFMPDITAVSLANVVAPVGIAQKAAAAGLRLSWTRIGGFSGELQMRRDVLMKELAEGQGLSVGRPAGGWSLLIDVTPFGIDAAEASRRLFADGVAATGMAGWGTERARRFVRLVFANEPVEHLIGVGAVVARGLVARGLANSI